MLGIGFLTLDHFVLRNVALHVVQMVELGFSAVASLAQTWDSAEPDEDEDGGKALASWKIGCASVAHTFAELLQRAWLVPVQVCLMLIHTKFTALFIHSSPNLVGERLQLHLHTTTVLVVHGCSLLSLVLFLRDKEEKAALQTATTTTTLTCPTMIQGVVGSNCYGVAYFLWLNFVCSYYVAPGENFKARTWEKIWMRQLILDNFPVDSINHLYPLHRLHQ